MGNDNTVKWQRLNLQLPPSRLRAHFVKATVRVHEYPDGALAVYWGPHRLAAHGMDGVLVQPASGLVAGTTPGEAVTRRISQPTHCIPLRNAMPGMTPVDLWTTPSGAACADSASNPVVHNSTGASSAEGRAIVSSAGRVPCRMTRFHRGLYPNACAKDRTRTKRTDHELQKPDRLTS